MQVSPFRDLRIKVYLPLPEAFRSLSRLSSALSAKASTLRSFQLNQLYHSYSVMNVGSGFVCVHKHSWFLSRMSCIFCVIKILVFSSMQFSRYTRMRARLKLESCGMLAFLSDYKFKCIGTQCHDRGSFASEVRIRYFRFTRYPGLP